MHIRYVAAACAVFCLLRAQAFSADAHLSVHTKPEGVEVWLDDKFLGDSPIEERPMVPGSYVLKLIDPIQRATVSERVVLLEGATAVVEKTITGRFGQLRVTTAPEGATVKISSVLGATPLVNDFMTPGKYCLEITHPSGLYAPVTEEATVIRGKTVDISHTLSLVNPFDRKALVRIGLGAGAAAAFVWAVVEEGDHRKYETRIADHNTLDIERDQKNADRHAAKRTVGIVAGSVCVLAFEIIAFF